VIRNHVEGSIFYKAEVKSRFNYYPATYHPLFGWEDHWTPTLWCDGVDQQTYYVVDVDSTRSVYKAKIEARRAVPSPLSLDLHIEFPTKDDSGIVNVEVVATDTIAFTGLKLRMAVIESGLISGQRVFDQVLRDYFPDTLGIPLSMVEGDTVNHSENFVIPTAWNAENCEIVAFVQNDTTREVLQAIQSPVVVPVPEEVADLIVTLVGDDLRLDWSAVTADTQGNPLAVDFYRIYRDTVAFFSLGGILLDSTVDTFYVDDTGVVGDTGTHYFYSVMAVSGGKESGLSGQVGEMDINILPAK